MTLACKLTANALGIASFPFALSHEELISLTLAASMDYPDPGSSASPSEKLDMTQWQQMEGLSPAGYYDSPVSGLVSYRMIGNQYRDF